MADAYLYASEGHYSQEMETLKSIDRFGLESITGRKQFYFCEYRKLIIAENIVTAYRERTSAKNIAEWARNNTEMARLLNQAERLVNGE